MGVRMRDYAAHTFIQGNTIAFNRGDGGSVGGVYVEHSPYNTIRRNSIYSNVGLGILLWRRRQPLAARAGHTHRHRDRCLWYGLPGLPGGDLLG